MDGGKDKPSLKESLTAVPTPEAPQESLHSDQKVEQLNNLLSRVKVDRPYHRELPEAPIIPELEESGRISTSPMAVNDDMKVEDVIKTLLDGSENFKLKYIENIEAVLSQYPDGVEIRVLTKHNDSIRAEVLKLLETEIRSKVTELVEKRQKVLQSYIDSYWPTVVNANLKKIERKKEKDEEEERQKKRAEDEEKLQSEIKNIILKSKMKFDEDMEAVLRPYSDEVRMSVLTNQNDSIRAEAMKLIEMESKSKGRKHDPVENPQNVLQSHIDGYWQTAMEANLKTMERKKEKDEEEERQQKIAQVQRKLQQQNGTTEGQKSAKSFIAMPQPQQNKSNQKSMPQVNEKPPLQTPLVFHLQSSRVVMGMDIKGHLTVLENESGEMQTPACVAVTSENKFIYGSEALALAQQDESGTDIHFWSIAEFLMKGNLCRSTRVFIRGTEHVITPEFFLAVLLSHLKETIEHRMDSQFTTTVIAIPFSFSSPQRIQIKDAAKIAGFSEVYLVNEASAAAFNFVLGDLHSSSAAEVLVLTENLDRVDAFVYSYHGSEKKLKMLGHARNYADETDKGQAWSLKKNPQENYKNLQSYVSTDGDSSKQDDSTSRTVRDACKSAIKDASFGRTKVEPNESIFICENFNRWSRILSNVAKYFGRKACDINQENAVVSGAILLGRNPKVIGRVVRDKLAYDVFTGRLQPVFAGFRMVSSKKQLLPENLRKQTVALPTGLTSATFHQNVCGVNHEIGKISINMSSNHDQYFEPSLDITSEGIVKFKSATIHSNHPNLRSRVTNYVSEEDIHWMTPNLSDEGLAVLASLLGSITVPKEDLALVQAKTCVLEKCQKMKESIAGDKFKLKSDLAKEMIAKKIEEAKELASHAKASLDDINKQMDILQRLCDKYEKK